MVGDTIISGSWRYWDDEKAVAYHGVAVGAVAVVLLGRRHGLSALLLFGQGEYASPCGEWLL